MPEFRNHIAVHDLAEAAASPDLRVFDCRFDLSNTGYGREHYALGHIPGSMYVSLDALSAPVSAHGGRHPLPQVQEMAAVFGRLGIEAGRSRVVIYDDAGGPYAARLWWMLRYCGHRNVRLLDGGWQAWREADSPVCTQPCTYPVAVFRPEVQKRMLADARDVQHRGDGVRLVDSRSAERYRGENETIDTVAGHIPGAENVPWTDVLDERLHLRPPRTLAGRFEGVRSDDVLYCGSGVTACMNVLAVEEASGVLPRLYAGSWSDWITHAGHPVATGPQP